MSIRSPKIECEIEYQIYDWGDADKRHAVIFNLYVHPAIRNKGLAHILMDAAISEIREKYGNILIKISPHPFTANGLSKEKLIEFYSKFDVEIIDE